MTKLLYLSGRDGETRAPLAGFTALAEDGEALGTIEGVLVAEEDQSLRHLVLGGGSGGRFVVPATAIERRDDRRRTVMLEGVTPERLGNSAYPSFDDQWLATVNAGRSAADETAPVESPAHTAVDAAPARPAGRPDALTTTDQAQLELLEERLVVRPERVQVGTVRVSKRVVTRTETLQVPLTEVHLVIERLPGDGEIVVDGKALGDGETIDLPLYTERARVVKEPVVAERVTIRTEAVERTEQVQEAVRREELEVKDGQEFVDTRQDGRPVEVNGRRLRSG